MTSYETAFNIVDYYGKCFRDTTDCAVCPIGLSHCHAIRRMVSRLHCYSAYRVIAQRYISSVHSNKIHKGASIIC